MNPDPSTPPPEPAQPPAFSGVKPPVLPSVRFIVAAASVLALILFFLVEAVGTGAGTTRAVIDTDFYGLLTLHIEGDPDRKTAAIYLKETKADAGLTWEQADGGVRVSILRSAINTNPLEVERKTSGAVAELERQLASAGIGLAQTDSDTTIGLELFWANTFDPVSARIEKESKDHPASCLVVFR